MRRMFQTLLDKTYSMWPVGAASLRSSAGTHCTHPPVVSRTKRAAHSTPRAIAGVAQPASNAHHASEQLHAAIGGSYHTAAASTTSSSSSSSKGPPNDNKRQLGVLLLEQEKQQQQQFAAGISHGDAAHQAGYAQHHGSTLQPQGRSSSHITTARYLIGVQHAAAQTPPSTWNRSAFAGQHIGQHTLVQGRPAFLQAHPSSQVMQQHSVSSPPHPGSRQLPTNGRIPPAANTIKFQALLQAASRGESAAVQQALEEQQHRQQQQQSLLMQPQQQLQQHHDYRPSTGQVQQQQQLHLPMPQPSKFSSPAVATPPQPPLQQVGQLNKAAIAHTATYMPQHRWQPYQQLQQQQEPLSRPSAVAVAAPETSITAAADAAASPVGWDPFRDYEELHIPEFLGGSATQSTRFLMRRLDNRLTEVPADVLVVNNRQDAKRVVDALLKTAREGVTWKDANGVERHERDVYFACDTEVAGIDVKSQSPVGHGTVTCFSIYAGPWIDFARHDSVVAAGQGAAASQHGELKSRIWVNLTGGWRNQLELQHEQEKAAAATRAASESAASAAAAEAAVAAQQGRQQLKQLRAQTLEIVPSDSVRLMGPAGSDAPDYNISSRRRSSNAAALAESGTAKIAASADSTTNSSSGNRRRRRRSIVQSIEQTAAQQTDATAADICTITNSSSNSNTVGAVSRALTSTAEFCGHIPAPAVADILADPEASGIIEEFRQFFEDSSIKKVWHNYGFDRHVLETLGFRMAGFGGDTLHMARLHDASRKLAGGYSLESLSGDRKLNAEVQRELACKWVGEGTDSTKAGGLSNAKRGMKERFGVFRTKTDGEPVKVPHIPGMHILQTVDQLKYEWIDYSALDAKATWNVHRALKSLLAKDDAIMDGYLCDKLKAFKPALGAAQASRHAAEATALSPPPVAAPPAATADKVKQAAALAPTPRAARIKGPTPGGLRRKSAELPATQAATRKATAATAAVAEGVSIGTDGGANGDKELSGDGYSMWQLYQDYWLPFGELLTDMELEGVKVDRVHLRHQEEQALQDQAAAEQYFRGWATKLVPGAEHMNVNSQVQVRQLLFPDQCAGPSKTFKATNPEYVKWQEAGSVGKRPRRWIDFELYGLWGKDMPGRLAVDVRTEKGIPAVSGAVLRTLAGKPGAAAKALADLNVIEAETTAAAAGISHLDTIDDHDDNLLDLDEEHHGVDGSSYASSSSSDSSIEMVVLPGGEMNPDDIAVLEADAADKKLGKMYVATGGGRAGLEACMALEKLIEVSAIDKLLTAFIQPLQQDNISSSRLTPHLRPNIDTASNNTNDASSAAFNVSSNGNNSSSNSVDVVANSSELPISSVSTYSTDDGGSSNDSASSSSRSFAVNGSSSSSIEQQLSHRVHCSLNLNTETGRLSARRPNLQNQPALEKDRYKVRKAFTAEVGKTLVVADYGQLELRLLAHMADCKSMIRAFELGGDFHSRTALGMYDHIKEAIARNECLLEWDGGSTGHEEPPAPLLKDKFASERRKAKILNFSIAYGKTAHGLSKDFGVSLEEAEETVNRWYADRPEVRRWQEMTRQYAREFGWVNTMIGRRRQLKDINSSEKWLRGRAERAAINTPIQGSAADVASAAMLSIGRDKWLTDNDWKLLLQVHDEVMLEGPKETAAKAKARVVAAMENPWYNLYGFEGKPLRVDLAVDANIADTWYEAK